MDLARKHEIAAETINSISRHDDEDALVRVAMLDRLVEYIHLERDAMMDRVRDRVAELKAAPDKG